MKNFNIALPFIEPVVIQLYIGRLSTNIFKKYYAYPPFFYYFRS